MKLESRDGSSFEMTVLGYQFPGIQNWLLIKLSLTNSAGTWTSTDPCLMIDEVVFLSNWMLVKKGCKIIEYDNWIQEHQTQFLHWEECSFMEQVIRFHWTQNEVGRDVLRVIVNGEYGEPYTENELWTDFPLDEIDLKETALNLREQLRKLPKRPGM